jgi:hypothetical protein
MEGQGGRGRELVGHKPASSVSPRAVCASATPWPRRIADASLELMAVESERVRGNTMTHAVTHDTRSRRCEPRADGRCTPQLAGASSTAAYSRRCGAMQWPTGERSPTAHRFQPLIATIASVNATISSGRTFARPPPTTRLPLLGSSVNASRPPSMECSRSLLKGPPNGRSARTVPGTAVKSRGGARRW